MPRTNVGNAAARAARSSSSSATVTVLHTPQLATMIAPEHDQRGRPPCPGARSSPRRVTPRHRARRASPSPRARPAPQPRHRDLRGLRAHRGLTARHGHHGPEPWALIPIDVAKPAWLPLFSQLIRSNKEKEGEVHEIFRPAHGAPPRAHQHPSLFFVFTWHTFQAVISTGFYTQAQRRCTHARSPLTRARTEAAQLCDPLRAHSALVRA